MNVPRYDDQPVTSVLQNIVANVQEMVRSEVQLAKTEIKEESTKAAKAGSLLAGGAVLALYAFGFILLGAVYALSMAVDAWLAAIIVAVAVGAPAAILIAVGRNRLREIHPKPQKTIDTVKENVKWVRDQTR